MTKKNPTDATNRNVRAANKKIAKLAERVKKLEAEVKRQRKLIADSARKLINSERVK